MKDPTLNRQKTHLLPHFYPLFSSTSPHSSSALHGRWIDDDDEALELLGRLEQPPGACGVSGLKRPRRRVLRIALLAKFLQRRVFRITLIAGGTRSRCGYPLDAIRSENWLGPTSSDLALYQVCDLIKSQMVVTNTFYGGLNLEQEEDYNFIQ